MSQTCQDSEAWPSRTVGASARRMMLRRRSLALFHVGPPRHGFGYFLSKQQSDTEDTRRWPKPRSKVPMRPSTRTPDSLRLTRSFGLQRPAAAIRKTAQYAHSMYSRQEPGARLALWMLRRTAQHPACRKRRHGCRWLCAPGRTTGRELTLVQGSESAGRASPIARCRAGAGCRQSASAHRRATHGGSSYTSTC